MQVTLILSPKYIVITNITQYLITCNFFLGGE